MALGNTNISVTRSRLRPKPPKLYFIQKSAEELEEKIVVVLLNYSK
jgi:hypothetical protein